MNMLMTVGAVYDSTDPALHVMAEALLKRVEGTGIDLLVLRREGDTLEATVDDSQADEPLCPMAFAGVVRQLSHRLLGEVWEGRLEFATILTATPITSPAPLFDGSPYCTVSLFHAYSGVGEQIYPKVYTHSPRTNVTAPPYSRCAHPPQVVLPLATLQSHGLHLRELPARRLAAG